MSLDQPISSHADESASPRSLLALFLRPIVAIPLVVVALLIALPFIFRAALVAGIPDIGDPFDVSKFGTVAIAPEDNAHVEYAAVSKRVSDYPADEQKSYEETIEKGWEAASDGLKKWLVSNEAALAEWRKGTAKPDAVYHQPGDMQIDTLLPDVQTLRAVARVAVIHGKRLEAEGKYDEAWETYRALFRSSRHSGKHGCLIERLVGSAMHAMAAKALVQWSQRPEVSAEALEKALRAVEADDALTAPLSRTLMTEYLFVVNTLRRPDLVQVAGGAGAGGTGGVDPTLARAGLFFMNEPLLCRLTLQQAFANILEHCDEPLATRPARHPGKFGLFDSKPGAAADPKRLDAAAIEKAAQKSIFARLLLPALEQAFKAFDRERARQETLRTALALQLHRRRHGKFPADLSALVERKLLDKVPIDPLSPKGDRLRYRVDAESAVVWSVGENGIDDGGKVDDSKVTDVGYVLPVKDAE